MKRSLLHPYIILLGMVLTTAPVYSQSASDSQVKTGFQYLQSEKFDSAVTAFSDILRTEPDNSPARLGLAIALVGIEKFPEASREIAKLLARSPSDPKLLEMAAQTFWQQKRYAETEIVLKRRLALSEAPGSIWALYGDALGAQGKTIEASAAYENAVKASPDSIDYRYALGSIYWKQIRYSDAEREFLDILKRKPNEPRASFNLGDIYLTKGDAAKAIPFLETAANAFPDEFDSQIGLGRAYMSIKKYQLAVEHLEKAVKLRPEIPQGFYQLGLALQRSGRLDEARSALKTFRDLQKAKLDSEKVPATPKTDQ